MKSDPMTNKSCMFALMALVPWAGCLCAQQEERSIRFVVLSESNASMTAVESEDESVGIPRIQFVYFDGGERRLVDAPASGFLGPLKTQLKDKRLAIYKPGVADQDQAQASDRLAVIEIPKGVTEVLLYSFRAHTKEHAQFRFLSDLAPLKERNQTLCLNMTGKDIDISISGQRFALKPYEQGVVDLKRFEGDLFTIQVAAEWKEDWKLVLSTARRLRKADSNILLFKAASKNPRSMSLKVLALPQEQRKQLGDG